MTASKRPRVVLVNRCFVKGGDGRWLIIKRAPNDANNAGKWEVPGGKVDEDQDLINAQEREVMEETGLLVESTQRLVTFQSFVIGKGRYKGLLYMALFHITQVLGGKFALSEEHTEYAWVTYNDMLSYDLTPEVKKAAIILEARLVQ